MSRRYRVGVVGFGTAGSLAAYLLAGDGHEVTLLDQAPRLGPVGAGVLLQPSGQAVLKRVGLLDPVLARAAPIDELDARHVGGRPLVCNRYGDYAPGFRAYGVHRGVLFGVLQAAVASRPVDVRLGCEVTAREVTAAGVVLVDATGRRHGPFDFVLAGDGARSRMRAACRLQAQVWPYPHATLWAIAPGTGIPGKLYQVVDGCRRLCGIVPLGDGLCTLYWGLPARDYPATVARGLEPLKREIRAFAPQAGELLDFVYSFDQFLLTRYQAVRMPRWHDRHTLFFGDAAHAMSPHLGQGVNLALVDAWRFAACLRAAPDHVAAFRAFTAVQKAYLRYYAAVTFALSPFFQGDWPVLGWGRDVCLPWLPRVPWVKRQMLMTVGGLKGGFLRGEVVP